MHTCKLLLLLIALVCRLGLPTGHITVAVPTSIQQAGHGSRVRRMLLVWGL